MINNGTMTGNEFRNCLDEIGVTTNWVVVRLAVTRSTVQRWIRGEKPIPQNVAEWLRAYKTFSEDRRLPIDWKTKSEKSQDRSSNRV